MSYKARHLRNPDLSSHKCHKTESPFAESSISCFPSSHSQRMSNKELEAKHRASRSRTAPPPPLGNVIRLLKVKTKVMEVFLIDSTKVYMVPARPWTYTGEKSCPTFWAAATDSQASNWNTTNGRRSVAQRMRAPHCNSIWPWLSYVIFQGSYFFMYKMKIKTTHTTWEIMDANWVDTCKVLRIVLNT